MVELPFSSKIKFALGLIVAVFVFFVVEMYIHDLSVYLIFLPTIFALVWVIGLYMLRKYASNFILSFLLALVILYMVFLLIFSANIDFYDIGNFSRGLFGGYG